jgi:hypothetical protein
VNVPPEDCATAIVAWLATPKNRSERTRLAFISRLRDSEKVGPQVKKGR